jgi:threonine dehydratase
VGERVFPIAQRYVDRVVLVSDRQIREAQEALWSLLRVVVEPGGAAAFAAVRSGRYPPPSGAHVGIVLSGGNTTAVEFEAQ